MRMMLRFTLPVEKSNAAIHDGSLGKTLESILSKLKPEAAYFTPLDGKRAGMIFFDMAEPSTDYLRSLHKQSYRPCAFTLIQNYVVP